MPITEVGPAPRPRSQPSFPIPSGGDQSGMAMLLNALQNVSSNQQARQMQRSSQEFQAAEAAKGRAFTAGESALDRSAQQAEQERTIQSNRELADYAQSGLAGVMPVGDFLKLSQPEREAALGRAIEARIAQQLKGRAADDKYTDTRTAALFQKALSQDVSAGKTQQAFAAMMAQVAAAQQGNILAAVIPLSDAYKKAAAALNAENNNVDLSFTAGGDAANKLLKARTASTGAFTGLSPFPIGSEGTSSLDRSFMPDYTPLQFDRKPGPAGMVPEELNTIQGLVRDAFAGTLHEDHVRAITDMIAAQHGGKQLPDNREMPQQLLSNGELPHVRSAIRGFLTQMRTRLSEQGAAAVDPATQQVIARMGEANIGPEDRKLYDRLGNSLVSVLVELDRFPSEAAINYAALDDLQRNVIEQLQTGGLTHASLQAGLKAATINGLQKMYNAAVTAGSLDMDPELVAQVRAEFDMLGYQIPETLKQVQVNGDAIREQLKGLIAQEESKFAAEVGALGQQGGKAAEQASIGAREAVMRAILGIREGEPAVERPTPGTVGPFDEEAAGLIQRASQVDKLIQQPGAEGLPGKELDTSGMEQSIGQLQPPVQPPAQPPVRPPAQTQGASKSQGTSKPLTTQPAALGPVLQFPVVSYEDGLRGLPEGWIPFAGPGIDFGRFAQGVSPEGQRQLASKRAHKKQAAIKERQYGDSMAATQALQQRMAMAPPMPAQAPSTRLPASAPIPRQRRPANQSGNPYGSPGQGVA